MKKEKDNMNLSEKTLLRVIACTLAAGLAVPYNIPVSTQTPAVSAEEAALTALSKADLDNTELPAFRF